MVTVFDGQLKFMTVSRAYIRLTVYTGFAHEAFKLRFRGFGYRLRGLDGLNDTYASRSAFISCLLIRLQDGNNLSRLTQAVSTRI